jgi:hypothetical protein
MLQELIMSCAYDWHDRGAYKTFTGFVSGADFVLSAEHVSANPHFDQLRIIYNDFLLISGHSIDVKAYARVSACRLGSLFTNPNYRVVFIATGQHAEDLASAIDPAEHSTPFHPHICSSMEAACSWFCAQPLRSLSRTWR